MNCSWATEKTILNVLLEHWCQTEEAGEKMFLKHIKSKDKNTFYQILLSGAEYDGIYKFKIGPSHLSIDIKDQNIILKTKDNLDFYLFEKNKNEENEGYLDPDSCRNYGQCIIRANYINEKCFKKALLKTGLINEEEYNFYTMKNKVVKNAPKIIIQVA